MNKQVKAALSAVRSLLSGSEDEAQIVGAHDKETRQAVAAELIAVMGRVSDPGSAEANETEQIAQEKERSRRLFMKLGYFDEAVEELRAGATASGRAAAARALGLVGSQRATVHLVAAMFDDDAEVRNAAGEALNQVGDPSVPGVSTAESLDSVSLTIETGSRGDERPQLVEVLDGRATQTSLIEEQYEVVVPLIESKTDLGSTELEAGVSAFAPSKPENGKSVDAEEQLLLEEHNARETIEEYERQIMASAGLRQKAENEARWRAEREAKIATEAEARRVEEEQLRLRAEEEASLRRSNEAEALAAELAARQQAEAEVHRLIAEETRLRLETANLRQAAEDLARQRRELETTRREEAESARLAQANRARQEAEKHHQSEVQRLHKEEQVLRFAHEEIVRRRSELESSRHKAESEISSLEAERDRLTAAAEAQIKQLKEQLEQLATAEAFRRAEAERHLQDAKERKESEEAELQRQMEALTKATNEVSTRRSEIEAANIKAEQDAERLAESLARMTAAETARAVAERERIDVEASTNERVEIEERLLDEARKRAAAEQSRLEEEKRRHDEAEERRMAALEQVHRKTEIEAQQRADREKQLHSEIDHLRIEDTEVRRRIEEAETLKRTSEQAYRVAAEKLQRSEAEAHAAALQENQTLSKLEAVRRDLAVQAQARAAQEKRIKEEIEQFHRLQDEERPRLEAAILQRTAAAARLQQMRETRVEVPSGEPLRHQVTASANSPAVESPSHAESSSPKDEGLRLVPTSSTNEADSDLPRTSDTSGPDMQPAVGLYLKSVDPYKRAAAVAELARTGGPTAFAEIARSFDDHSAQVRNAAARALAQLEPTRTVDFFNRAIEEGTEQRGHMIGAAIAGSGMAGEAIDNLASENRENTYNALSILFVMAKTGEVQSLVKAVEDHPNDEVRKAVVKLLTLSGHSDLADQAAKRRQGS